MNLKEAFRYEKFLSHLFKEGLDRMQHNPTKTLFEHRRHAAYPAHEDVTYKEDSDRPDPDNDEILSFLLYVINQKRELGDAIRAAKSGAEVNIDTEMQVNNMRRYLYKSLECMLENRPKTVVSTGDGVGYYFDKDGSQKEYHYDVAEKTVINFDRQHFGETATRLARQAEISSSGIERQMVLVQVDYEPPFEVYGTMLQALEKFTKQKKKLAG